MNSSEIEKIITKATGITKNIVAEKTLPKPRSLGSVAEARIAERELEKIAPKTGMIGLDKLIRGFIPGHLYTITGATNVGKTKLAANFALQVAFQSKRVLYISLEPENMIIEYIASIFHDKRFDELLDEELDVEGLDIQVMGKEEIPSVDALVDVIDVYNRYDLIVIDHIGYFITSQSNHIQQQSNTVKQLAGLAKKNNCAIMLIAHLRKTSRSGERNRVVTGDDISGSAAFSQDSTEVLIAVRDMQSEDKDEVIYADTGRLIVAKTKVGGNGLIKLRFHDGKAVISEL